MKKEQISGEEAQKEAPKEVLKESDLLEQLQRLQAEFMNYRTRVEKEKVQIKEITTNIILSKLLEVKDNFDRAPKLDKGMLMIYNQFQSIFKNANVQEMQHKVFDPKIHEAIATDANKEKDTIVKVFEKGYTRNDHTIRTAKVIVGAKENKK
jgi:molecular chaperone GrpE